MPAKLQTVWDRLRTLDKVARERLLSVKSGAGSADLVLDVAFAMVQPIEQLEKNQPRVHKLTQQVEAAGGGAGLFDRDKLTTAYLGAVGIRTHVGMLGSWAAEAKPYYVACETNLTAVAGWTTSTIEEAKAHLVAADQVAASGNAQAIVEALSQIQDWIKGVTTATAERHHIWTESFKEWNVTTEPPAHLLLHTEITEQLAMLTNHLNEADQACQAAIDGHQAR